MLSLAAAAAITPVINYLTQRGVRYAIALVITYVSFSVLVIGLFILLSRPLAQDMQQMTNNLTFGYENIVASWSNSDNIVQSTIASQLPPARDLFASLSGEEGRKTLQGLLGTASSLAGFMGQAVVIIILSIYWSSDRVRFERLWMSLIPVDLRTQARSVWRDIESGVGAYILGELVQSYLVVLILWLGFSLIGLPQPALLALFSALFWFIPWLGAVLALIPVILSGLTVSPLVAAGAGLLTVAALVLMELFVQPRFFSRQRYNSLLLVLVVIILTQAFGLIGLILAPALAVALQIGFGNILIRREKQLKNEHVSEEINQLQACLQDLQERVQSPDLTAAPELLNLIERLQSLMEKTTGYLADSGEIPRSMVSIRK